MKCVINYRIRSEDEGEDVVDSDFSIDENDEVVSDDGIEDKPTRSKLVYKVSLNFEEKNLFYIILNF